MHKTEEIKYERCFYIRITSNVEVGEARCGDPMRLLQAPAYSFSFSDGGNGPKGALNDESSSKGELGFQEQFFGRVRMLVIVDVK